jgi:hypothetical protein
LSEECGRDGSLALAAVVALALVAFKAPWRPEPGVWSRLRPTHARVGVPILAAGVKRQGGAFVTRSEVVR